MMTKLFNIAKLKIGGNSCKLQMNEYNISFTCYNTNIVHAVYTMLTSKLFNPYHAKFNSENVQQYLHFLWFLNT